MKLGRNKPCWCGSGKKYKKCHLNRETQKPLSIGIMHKQLNGFYSKKYCSVPDSMKSACSGKIIGAHSISKSASLKEIAHNGHVLTTFKHSTNFKNFKDAFDITPTKVGIQKASTFTGFCAHHDKHLFQPVEDDTFTISDFNCFLIAYRAISRELFVKERSSDRLDLIKELDRGNSLEQQKLIQAIHKERSTYNKLTISDLKYIKSKLDYMLVNSDFSKLNHLVFTLSSPPKVMTSATVAPAFDFQGETIQDLSQQNSNDIPGYIMINSFSCSGLGYICLSWVDGHSHIVDKFYKSLMNTPNIAASLLAFIFASIENNYLSEEWWNSLDDSQKSYLMDLFSQGVRIPLYDCALKDAKDLQAFNIIATQKLPVSAAAS